MRYGPTTSVSPFMSSHEAVRLLPQLALQVVDDLDNRSVGADHSGEIEVENRVGAEIGTGLATSLGLTKS